MRASSRNDARSAAVVGTLILFLLALCGLPPSVGAGEAEKHLALRVGLLIDGSGGEPVKDAVIVIRGDRIVAAGKSGEVPIPAGSRIIRAANQTALPGFVDAHAHYREWQGEIYLNHGVTTAFDIGSNPLNWSIAQREGIDKGKIVGPRLLLAGRIDHAGEGDGGDGSTRGRTGIVVANPEQAREQVKKLIALGVDVIKALEDLSRDELRAIVEEAHRAGKPVIAHSINGTEAILDGVAIGSMEHSHSVAMATVRSEETKKRLHEGRSRRRNRLTTQEIHDFMEPENYDRVIGALVSQNTHWTPTLATTWRAFSSNRRGFDDHEAKLLALSGLKYIPPYFRANTREYFSGTAELDPELLKRIQSGYEKLKDFLSRFVKAGGRVQTGSDPNSVLPGLAIHWELELLVEAGLAPMEALLAATRNPAERMGRQNDFGSIAPGRFADIVIVDGNPIEDISATRRIRMVFKEGKMRDLRYHGGYRNPIPRPEPDRPAPVIEEISPDLITERGGPQRLTIKGINFLNTAVVKLDGKTVPSQVESRRSRFPQNFRRNREIVATIPSNLIAKPGSYSIVVEHPGSGGAVSNSAALIVKFR